MKCPTTNFITGRPPPAIAVSGTDGLQLWFSLVEPVPVARAHAFLDGLRTHFLGEIPPARIALMPALAGSVSGERAHAPLVPALQARTGLWSAFVAPDLAAVFADTPGLDIPPGEDGQAGLLQGLESIKPGAFEAAAARLGLAQTPAVNTATSNNPTLSAAPSPPAGAVAPGLPIPAARWPTGDDPRRFLQQVMNDDSVTLALRIEAAKVLLQHAGSATD